MFDCPDPTHTSPTSTSFSTMVFLPFTVSESAGPTLSGSSFTRQSPLASAFVVLVCPAMLTVTSSSGAAVPQTGAGTSRCKSMWSEKTGGNFTSARSAGTQRENAASSAAAVKEECRFIG